MKLDCQKILKLTQEELLHESNVTLQQASPQELHQALARAVMASIGDAWAAGKAARASKRKAYYFSAEYLIGRTVYGDLFNLGILPELRELFRAAGAPLECLEEIEDAALGNGGLGRLAACFLDSAATMNLPLTGYGLRYRFGLFRQRFAPDGSQQELADHWTRYGDPWSHRRYSHMVRISFPDQTVIAVPYDMPVPGYGTDYIGTLRLWQCEAEEELDFDAFNAQHYEKALSAKNQAENITRVLYPNDSTWEGKRLRIKQEYVLSSASLQDILRAFAENHGPDFRRLAEFVSIQLNDTHPAMSIPELIRLLQERGISFDESFAIARQVFSYTNHTVMAEALEKWDMNLLESVVPQICRVLRQLDEKLRREQPGLFLIQNHTAHMANLCVYGSRYVNGVAELHTRILCQELFRDWYRIDPQRFQNKTNGITPRRWLGLSNPELTDLLTRHIGPGFLTDLERLQQLRPITDDMVREFAAVKRRKKEQLAQLLQKQEGIRVNPEFLFDVQVKRAHEYKRQLMNALSIADLYFRLKEGSLPEFTPTLFLFGAKAAPGYARAKAIIRYINRLAKLIDSDPAVRGRMQVVFVQNYNCSYAEAIIPAADVSEQISPAGTEASGTGNMKLMLNGAVTLGTLDGANVEIVQEAGRENNYIFGATVEELNQIRANYWPREIYNRNPRLHRAVDTLVNGTVPTDDAQRELYTALLDGASWHRPDHYFVLKDYDSYLEAKLRANRDYRDPLYFHRKCLENVAAAGKFSADRTVRQYAGEIWHIDPVQMDDRLSKTP